MEVKSSPAVSDGMVFVGSHDNYLYALNQTTGEVVWNHTALGNIQSSPAVADGRVFFGTYAAADGYLYALDRETGELNWSRRLVGGWVYSSPTVVYGKVYVTAFQTTGDHYGYVFALDRDTGQTVWSWRVRSTGYYDDDMYAHSSPAVFGGLVFFGAHSQYYRTSRVYVLNATDGSVKWERTIGGGNGVYQYSSPALAGRSRVFIGNDDGYLYCLDFDDGSERWKFKTEAAIRSSPAIADGKVFVGSDDGTVYALTQFGDSIWNFTTNGKVCSSPAVTDDGKVIVGSDDGNLYALNEDDGSLIWKYRIGFSVRSSPAVADGHIFVGSNDGKVYAFGPGPRRIQSTVYFILAPNPTSVGETIRLRGILVDEISRPLSDETVELYAHPLAGSWVYVTSLITSNYGIFTWQVTIPEIPSGTYIFAAYYPGSEIYESTYNFAVLIIQ